MIIAVLVVLGLCLGSFVNALIWRVREQSKETGKKSPDSKYLRKLSIRRGRSMCPHCRHELKPADLIPFFSWLSLKGKCRYCSKPISTQYPIVEVAMALLFVASYTWWPADIRGSQVILFGLWLPILTGLMALLVYDLRWYLLPNRIVRPLGYLSGLYALAYIVVSDHPLRAVLNTFLAVLAGGGLFYILFQVSKGKWIGGGDVKLGWVLGLLLATPGRSVLMIFLASLLGTAVSVPLLAAHKVKRTSVIPFGPFLIVAAILVHLFGHDILYWYQQTFFPYTL
jgi:prepilin signal peptidase PulO-like enzyme (type II secretory pathway)